MLPPSFMFLVIVAFCIQVYPTEGRKEEICANTAQYRSFLLPENGQAFYMETQKYSSRWHYSTPDQWIQKDYHPKDELIDAEDNWPMWIWHRCGHDDGWSLVCIESGRYPNYYAYNSGKLAISHSYNHRARSDWKWTHWYVMRVREDGYVFLCNYQTSPGDPESCNRGLAVYIYVPPSCAGWERKNCCHNLACEFSYEQGITKTRGSSTTATFGAEISATFEKSLTKILSVGGSASLSSSISQTISSGVSATRKETITMKMEEDHCLWVEFQNYGEKGEWTMKGRNWKACYGEDFCFH